MSIEFGWPFIFVCQYPWCSVLDLVKRQVILVRLQIDHNTYTTHLSRKALYGALWLFMKLCLLVQCLERTISPSILWRESARLEWSRRPQHTQRIWNNLGFSTRLICSWRDISLRLEGLNLSFLGFTLGAAIMLDDEVECAIGAQV